METNIRITHFGSKSIAVVLRQIRQRQVLSRVYGKELTDLHHHHQSVSVKYPKLWGDDSELLHAHFGHVTERSTPQVRRRGYYLLALAGLGAVLLFNSSSSCWGCINDVSLGKHRWFIWCGSTALAIRVLWKTQWQWHPMFSRSSLPCNSDLCTAGDLSIRSERW